MHFLFQRRCTWIARLALGLALFAQFVLAAEACVLPQRSLGGAPGVVSSAVQDQHLPCSGAGCVAKLPETDVCRAEVTADDQAPGPFAITVTPGAAGLSSFMLAPRKAVAPLAPRPGLVADGSGSRLSILFCSFQI